MRHHMGNAVVVLGCLTPNQRTEDSQEQDYSAVVRELFSGGCHGDDEKAVFAPLCEIVHDTIALYLQDGTPLPEPTCGKDYSNPILKMLQAS